MERVAKPNQPTGERLAPTQGDPTTHSYFAHSQGERVSTDAVLAQALRQQYPGLQLVIAPQSTSDLLGYAAAGNAAITRFESVDTTVPASLSWTLYGPPANRLDGGAGALLEKVVFAKYRYRWREQDFIVYLADGRDGMASYPQVTNFYVLATDEQLAYDLVLEAGRWGSTLRDEIWVYDQGSWQKSKELFRSVRSASWGNVILDPGMKKAIIDDHLTFFRSRETYSGLGVPWKRGLIYYGPPGNGKTISVKAMMHTLYQLDEAIPALYVRSLTSFMGPEMSIRFIYQKARQMAPCYLIFEDLDSIVSDNVRSYFLNEVDGLKSNDGIFMVGSTNHLDRLDPGISKRPSRFDRKYFFPDPNLEQRVAYCRFWQGKLVGSDEVEFPDELCTAIAEITDKFSFAYMQEAFVAALLAIARDASGEAAGDDWGTLTEDLADDWVGVLPAAPGSRDGLECNGLWIEIQKQVKILREGMEMERM